jgi:hypothetical protein
MLYLLDASVLITANNLYYAVDRVPEFWEWLNHVGTRGQVKIGVENFEEITEGPKDAEKDLLFAWLQNAANSDALILDEEADQALIQKAVASGYAPDLTDDEIEQLGRDPFLLAYALRSPPERTVVTMEVSKPSRTRQNRHLPDVCKTLGLNCCDTFGLIRALGFRTDWKKAG